MKIFVINLPKSVERRESAEKQMAAAGVDFEFFTALNATQAMSEWFDGYNEREFMLNTGRRSSEGEKGCYASHLALWKHCVAIDQPIMIMEDDFQLASGFSAAVDQVTALIAEYGSIRLQEAPRRAETRVTEAGDFELYRYRRMPHCLMCYAVSPAVAQALISHSATINEPVDVLTKKFWLHKQPMYCLLPYTVFSSDHSSDSTVQHRVSEAKPVAIKLQRPFRKLGWELQRHFANAKYAIFKRY